MSLAGPIIVIDDDEDDQQLFSETIQELNISNPVIFFSTCAEVLPYLMTTTDKPFVIIPDVNLPIMSGTELKREINNNEYLRRKSIPFIFFTTSASPKAVAEAYDLMVQGYFEKDNSYAAFKQTIKIILQYWTLCRHPNSG